MSSERGPETCARCGHTTLGCENCDRVDPFLGASIYGVRYCHTFSPGYPTCYMDASYEYQHSSKFAVDSHATGVQIGNGMTMNVDIRGDSS